MERLKVFELVVALAALVLSVVALWRQQTYPYQETIFAERVTAVAALNETVEQSVSVGLSAVGTTPDSIAQAQFGETLPRMYSAFDRVDLLMLDALQNERDAYRQSAENFIDTIDDSDVRQAEDRASELQSARRRFEAAFRDSYIGRYEP